MAREVGGMSSKDKVWIGYKKTTERRFAGKPYDLLVARVPGKKWVIGDEEMKKLTKEAKKLGLV
jgi:hypothetical protein